jgi:hypothetical protein
MTKLKKLKIAICLVFFEQITRYIRWRNDCIVDGYYVVMISFGIYDWLHYINTNLLFIYMDYGYFIANTKFQYLSSDAKRFLVNKLIVEDEYPDYTNEEVNDLVQNKLKLSDTKMSIIREEIVPYA